ncbi:MAG: phosphoribosylamine--glycine ligase [Candidatus Roizmanbacteria bacterium]
MKKNILIIGDGAREHALGWKLRQSEQIGDIYFSPGNAGTVNVGINIEVFPTDFKALVTFVKEKNVDLTIVGSEELLEKGIVDYFQKKKLLIFGPTKKSAQIETSKAWASQFMYKYAIPEAESYSFTSYEKALEFSKKEHRLFVVKASGLASGKGVIVPQSKEEEFKAIEEVMVQKKFGDAGSSIVLQELLQGVEVSLLAFCDGKNIVPMLPAQDHKRIFDFDQGPNTGGMGTYTPLPFVNEDMLTSLRQTILQPFIYGMYKEGHPYKGVIFAGIMLTKDGPKVLEFNARFGDPETESLMLMLDTELHPILEACAQGTLEESLVRFKSGSACCVVLASSGYPSPTVSGEIIHGLNNVYDSEVKLFYAGAVETDGEIVANGGRAMVVAGYGETIKEALEKVYNSIGEKGVHFSGMQYRRDIAWQSLK